MARITLSVQLGALVLVRIEGDNVGDITTALQGYDELNKTVGAMFGDLAERVYPDDDTKSDHAAAPYGGKKE